MVGFISSLSSHLAYFHGLTVHLRRCVLFTSWYRNWISGVKQQGSRSSSAAVSSVCGWVKRADGSGEKDHCVSTERALKLATDSRLYLYTLLQTRLDQLALYNIGAEVA